MLLLSSLAVSYATTNIAIKSGYDFTKVKKVAVLAFNPSPDNPNSGVMVADIFAINLLKAGYDVIERNDLAKVLAEQHLDSVGAISNDQLRTIGKVSGVDAIITGSVPVYTPARKEVVLVNERSFNTNTTYNTIKRPKATQVEGQAEQNYYNDTQKIVTHTYNEQDTPVTHIIDAEIGVTAKMIDVKTGEVIWIASDTYEGTNIQTAAEYLVSSLVDTLEKEIRKPRK
jgi:hypothetical protein